MSECEAFLQQQGAWTTVFQLHDYETFESYLYYWLNTADFSQIQRATQAGATIVVPDFPYPLGANFDQSQYEQFAAFREQHSITSISTRSVKDIFSQTPNDHAIDAWLQCVQNTTRQGVFVTNETREGDTLILEVLYRGVGAHQPDLTYILSHPNMQVVAEPHRLISGIRKHFTFKILDT